MTNKFMTNPVKILVKRDELTLGIFIYQYFFKRVLNNSL